MAEEDTKIDYDLDSAEDGEEIIHFLSSYLTKTLRLKIDKWHKLMTSDDTRSIVLRWLSNPNERLLLITVNQTGYFQPMLKSHIENMLNRTPLVTIISLPWRVTQSNIFQITPSIKSKTCYFIRKTLPTSLTNENYRDNIIFGDTSTRSIEDLAVLVEEIFFPLLSNQVNRIDWPEPIAKDVESHMQELRDVVAEVRGNIVNKTILPMPITVARVMAACGGIVAGNRDLCDVKMKNSLECTIIKWASQINDVLQQNSETFFDSIGARHPTPMMEVSFWQARQENLENIYQQLQNERCKAIGNVLEAIDSVYYSSFKMMFKNVVAALYESRDITLYLLPLITHFEQVENTDFASCSPLLKPMLHCVCLTFAHSKYYNKTPRICALFRMIVNLLIDKAFKALDPDTLFRRDMDESLVLLNTALSILNRFQDLFHICRDRLPEYTKYGNTVIWSFRMETVFERLIAFRERLLLIKMIFETANDYTKLEKVEIAGLKGRTIGKRIAKVSQEFQVAFENWSTINFNALDPDPARDDFTNHWQSFTKECQTLERKLSYLFVQAFDECQNFDQAWKLIQMIWCILKRPFIYAEVEHKFYSVMKLYENLLNLMEYQFERGVSSYKSQGLAALPSNRFFPPVSGALQWIDELKQHISAPIKDISLIDIPLFTSEEGEKILQRSQKMLSDMTALGECIFAEWRDNVSSVVSKGIQKNLLLRQNDLLSINLDEDLEVVLKEVKHINLIGKADIPKDVLDIYAKQDIIWKSKVKLSLIVVNYNAIRQDTEPCEYKLFKASVEEIDETLKKALESFTWKTLDLEYIEMVYKKTEQLNDKIQKIHDNVREAISSIKTWGCKPFFERRDRNPKSLLNIDEKPDVIKKRSAECLKSTEMIQKAIECNLKLFRDNLEDKTFSEKGLQVSFSDPEDAEEDTESSQQELYSEYRNYVDDLVLVEIKSAIMNSLQFIKAEMEKRGTSHTILEVHLELQDQEMIFTPDLEENSVCGFISRVEEMMDAIISMANFVPRVNRVKKTYKEIVNEDDEIATVKHEIRTNVLKTIKQAKQEVKMFEKYRFLWVDDKSRFLEKIQKSKTVTFAVDEEAATEEVAVEMEEEEDNTLEQFRENIDRYYQLYDDIDKIEEKIVINGWFSLDVAAFKQSLLNEVAKWIDVHKQYLMSEVEKQLSELSQFIRSGMATLNLEIDRDDYETLLKVMDVLAQVRDRRNDINNLFGPISNTIEMLRLYGDDFNEDIHTKLTDLPEEWNRMRKLSVQVKQSIAPIKAYQMEQISQRIVQFDIYLQVYRDFFREFPNYVQTFKDPCYRVYVCCDKKNIEITRLEDQLQFLTDSARLFELHAPENAKVLLCRREIRLVKQLWDFVFCVESCIEHWKMTPWKKIDVEEMEQECKKFTKEIRALDKDVRDWEPYIYVEMILKNLVTSMRAITELQNPAIRERHWIELMKATKLLDIYKLEDLIEFRTNEATTLEGLLDLNLHNHEEEVKNIVDKSVKEMQMEKTLSDLDMTWREMTFEFELHERTELNLLRASEGLVETLEDNQVQLQNLIASKHVHYFYREISEWQAKLSNVDQATTTYFEVQRKWMYLENIFIGSEDIRNQLPKDTERFDDIDAKFRRLLQQMSEAKIVIHIIELEGLHERLDDVLKLLVLCEKALNDYLETKRLAFPRFYFVSSADLLNILSNGNRPEFVGRHLTKLFDSIAKLKYLEDGKTAIGMHSKENDEFVEFCRRCDCTGKVEEWLGKVTETMRSTLHALFEASVVAYEKKPRHQWIFNWPAQTALCGTQIWWTTDVNVAFEMMEEGYETSLREYLKKQVAQLNALINLLLGDLSIGDRQKIMTVCTIDVHSRDVVAKMVAQKVEQATAFQWQSQLRHRWDCAAKDCFANICDAQFRYDYEYLGNTPRLVITPLTDRCYITLTQSLHLVMGGAPAGPAGTGKTETTKDLGRALGIMVYVFNCSEQMDYKSCGNIYKGLAQTGAWGCFDEFNRISAEVLSVVAVQVKSIQDAIKTKKTTFSFMGETIRLIPTVGLFITMNPGYAGRTELPENLKALFRPCSMIVPDFALICEIMLVAEGFQEARILARKFITLYTLCRELLSKQDHYDWGLRAIKSVLVVAGSLKRGDRQRPEDQVLMRALRDFNIPKIVTDDVPVFMGLIGDLFPALDVPRKRSPEFEKLIKKAATELKLQADNNFVLKVVQLEELFAVRHSVFIVGSAGTGKTQVWKTLFRTYQLENRKPHYNDLNPKAVTNDDLFGIINPTTREWKDGLFSYIMRDQANMGGSGSKWIVLDGDIDPMWIESLNTVMDDNKVLTLASNERIALTKEMRLLFEIGHLKYATPATVSRAGILYINPQDLGWYPYVASWMDTRDDREKMHLILLFEKYVPHLVTSAGKFRKITPISDIAMVQMVCHLLDCLLTPANVPLDSPKDVYELYFVFAAIWGFGSALYQDQMFDWRVEFTKWWFSEFKDVSFPDDISIFNCYIDNRTQKFAKWKAMIPQCDLDLDIPLQSILVPTVETTRLRYFMDILMERRRPVMLVGGAGSGKSVIVSDKLNNLQDSYLVTNAPFNFYTTSNMLQSVLEMPLEKKAGRNFGPPGNKQMIYFIDDINMPEVDQFGTVQPHTIIRQFMDYQHWYDRSKLTLKEIHNCQFAACMNPTSGSFTIDPRLQRHFTVFAVNFPSSESLLQIYSTILTQHLEDSSNKFVPSVQRLCTQVTDAALTLHTRMSQMFLPNAIKFHYVFNMRDLANIFTGILYATHETCPDDTSMARLYIHEATRVYSDKLVNMKDINSFKKLAREIARKSFEDCDEHKMFEEPLIYCHFSESLSDPKYMPVKSWESLSKLLDQAQVNYNELVGHLDLVLFEDAMAHVCRISRILEAPRGNALLIGVGGSGKQSLARLAAFISTLSVFQIQLRKDYGMQDLRNDIAALYLKVGVKNVPSVFLISDAQVPEEDFLVLINDMLASGEVPDLFPEDDIESIVAAVKNEVKQSGMLDTKQNCWKFFIDKVRQQLKIVLCFSPVGSTLRVRARKFPAIVNCTAINWFHEWPQSALESVSFKFLSKLNCLSPELRTSVSEFMAYVHGTVNEMSEIYLLNEKRYNYTTPKSFLELISLYSKLLTAKNEEAEERIFRLENGLTKLSECARQVDFLQAQLAEQEINLKIKNEAADKLIVVVSAENMMVQKEKNISALEEQKVRRIEEDVSVKAKLCEEDLRKAEPALVAAQEALNTLNKNNLTELRSFGAPPEAVVNVCAAVMVLFAPKGKIPKDRSWRAAKVMMGKVDTFLNDLITYDKEHIHPKVIEALQPYLEDPEFDPEAIMGKSAAAAGLCAWVININKFYEVYQIVEPKQKALQAAQDELQAAQEKLQFLNNKIHELEVKLNVIKSEFDAAIAEKQRYQQEADKTAFTIDLANRLVGGLASENVRWRESVLQSKLKIGNLSGDALLVSCFISYVGSFTRRYRIDLLEKMWIPTFNSITPLIPHSPGNDPLSLICDDALTASWNNEGLPNDRMSTENAAILTNSTRWPLMIDPQLQGIKWIKQKYAKNLVVLRLSQKGYLDVIEKALTSGSVLLIENIGESVDAVLDPLLGRALIRKGKFIKIGDKEIDYHPDFRLILQTKHANPHYKPEMQAQTTLINFTVTRDGLEEQLLAGVVKIERPDLEKQKADLTMQQNSFKISLKHLEDDLLRRLANAGDNVLEDPTLVFNLEKTKKTAADIEIKVIEAKITSSQIDIARENYRSVAERASILYFILNDLYKINPIYQFSLKAFVVVFHKAIINAPQTPKINQRVINLIDSITFAVFQYTCRGLFERDKLIFMAQMMIQILLHASAIKQVQLDFLLRYPYIPNTISPFDFLSNTSWGGIKALTLIEDFHGLDKDIEASAKRWKKFIESETPEREKLPGEWKAKRSVQRLCIMRALRPDRMTYAVKVFIEEKLGFQYVDTKIIDFASSFEETNATTPIFFILSPGVDPLVEVEKLGQKLGYSMENGNFFNVSLGQGQEVVAEAAIDESARHGHWVILQNIHLVSKWLPTLEKRVEASSEIAHDNYRLFLSAEPAPSAEYHCIPQSLLESSIKITNEPPTGMRANLHQALNNFSQDTLEMCTKEPEFKAILFSLCYFHAVVAERRKFGAQGWNKNYPFNVGDLTISVYVLYNYLEANSRVPWEDLRYLFGEIMYGGHITDDWDRRLCKTYLEEYLQPDLVGGELHFCPGFQVPPNSDYTGYHSYIDNNLPSESPHLYGLNPNAEIGFLTSVSEHLFRTVLELQPRESASSAGAPILKEDAVRMIIEDLSDKVPDEFNITEMMVRVEERSPFIVVAFQECERMNILMREIRRSLRELHLGLKGELTVTAEMEVLQEDLFYDRIPEYWERLAYPSCLGLQCWLADLMLRFKELEQWSSDFVLPSSVWLGGFFNPQSFLTAIMQQTARRNELPLDRMCLTCEVTQKFREDFTAPPKEGAFINGLFMDGAQWDMLENAMIPARLKELSSMMPVVFVKAITQDKQDLKNIYECPVYKTRARGSTYVWTFNLRTLERSSKWILGGVCLLLQT
ncbi:dynein beta chain, ciliary-like [Phlebotomus argentipes]|uniref:dynein beta chain, ciliary-like n=1 Tax=Phlebotomus argentipes TaxID=94469 RepID=UPI002892CC25|nr:dynein beta chain, ciliary-like [Phlebotomus argentipes]